MKDERLFLETEFTLNNLISIRTQLIENGWIIIAINNTVKIFESKNDMDDDDEEMMCENTAKTPELALLACLIEIKKYYHRVTT